MTVNSPQKSTPAALRNLYLEVYDGLVRLHNQRSAYRYSRYGWTGKLYSWLGLFDVDTLRKSHWNVNCWTNEEAFAWKEACMASHNYVMVAASIFASIGLIAQTQTSMKDTHWSARALLTASMICGIVALVAALLIQESLRRLHSHMDIRLWLSNGASTARSRYKDPHNMLPLESSVASHKLVDAPVKFLMLAVGLYVVGFGVYLAYGWLYALEQPASDFRNIFIVYVAVVCVSVSYFTSLGAWQSLDRQRLHARLKTDRFAPRIHMSQEFRNLERIITLLVDFRRANEEKLQVGTESSEDSSLMLDLLLQLWDETEQQDQHDPPGHLTSQNTTGSNGAGRDTERGDMIQRGYSTLRGEACNNSTLDTISDSKLAPPSLHQDLKMAGEESIERSVSSRAQGRPVSI